MKSKKLTEIANQTEINNVLVKFSQKEEYSHLTDFKGEAQIIQSVREENLYRLL